MDAPVVAVITGCGLGYLLGLITAALLTPSVIRWVARLESESPGLVRQAGELAKRKERR